MMGQELLQPGNVTLRCGSAVDLIVLLDGSGSLGRYGWKQSKDMAIKFIQSMKGSGKDHSLSLVCLSRFSEVLM